MEVSRKSGPSYLLKTPGVLCEDIKKKAKTDLMQALDPDNHRRVAKKGRHDSRQISMSDFASVRKFRHKPRDFLLRGANEP